MATRRKRKQAARGGSGGGSAMGWFGGGLVLGLAGAVFLFYKGYLPAPPRGAEPVSSGASGGEQQILGDSDEIAAESSEPRYDFFTVLPEMEVLVPEEQLAGESSPDDTSTSSPDDITQYVLQAGSFKSSDDADQMKARLALLGSVANIQRVTVNDETWHRVRIGPVQGARQADDVRRKLLDNGIEVLVLKVSS